MAVIAQRHGPHLVSKLPECTDAYFPVYSSGVSSEVYIADTFAYLPNLSENITPFGSPGLPNMPKVIYAGPFSFLL